jgi:DNA-binding CsgD family transcriptional regulator
LLSAGRGTKEIAIALDLSPRTVEFYINSIKEKTGLHSRAQIRDAIQSAVKAF